MTTPILSLNAARALHLAAQGLLFAPKRPAKPEDVVNVIRQMGLLQIDTISVVARSPYLVLFSRLGSYPQAWLNDALLQGKIFEYWAHEACFIPMEDYALLHHRMLDPTGMGRKFDVEWENRHQDEMQQLIEHIRQTGPVRSADFNRKEPAAAGGWWNRKPEKRHLETLFTLGKVMIKERRNFQRVYDLSERILPNHWHEQHALTKDAAQFEMIRKSCGYLGITQTEWLADYYRLSRIKPQLIVDQLRDQGEIIAVNVEGFSADFYLHHTLLPLLEQAKQDQLRSTVTTLLSPFDPVVWDRRRASALFHFDYRLECYTPGPKRQFGYFCLPLLQRGQLIGRLDCKMHRAESTLEVKSLHLEKNIKITAGRNKEIQQALVKFAHWQGATSIQLTDVPKAFAQGATTIKVSE